MSRMSELYIQIMEEAYNKLSEEEKLRLRLIEQELIELSENCDNSP